MPQQWVNNMLQNQDAKPSFSVQELKDYVFFKQFTTYISNYMSVNNFVLNSANTYFDNVDLEAYAWRQVAYEKGNTKCNMAVATSFQMDNNPTSPTSGKYVLRLYLKCSDQIESKYILA